MPAIDIINGIWVALMTSADFLISFGLDPNTATIEQKSNRLQKEREPEGLAVQNLPLACIYPVPGFKKRWNYTIYEAEFQIDFYARSLFLAMASGRAAQTLLNNKTPPIPGGFVFECEFLDDFAGESRVMGIKKYSQRYAINDIVVK